MARALDTLLKERLRSVLRGEPVTEAELRRMFEDGQACLLLLNTELERIERALAELASDPESSISELASACRRISKLRPDLDELRALLNDVEDRAREFRESWIRT
jgi:hypothetical protein